MKELEKENARLRRAVSDLMLDKLILQAPRRETSEPPRRRRCIDHIRGMMPASVHRPRNRRRRHLALAINTDHSVGGGQLTGGWKTRHHTVPPAA